MIHQNLDQLAQLREEAKAEEEAAIAKRREIDTKIAELLWDDDAERTASYTGSFYKVKVQYKVTRKVDSDKLATVWNNLSEYSQAAFKWSADVSVTGLKKLRDNRPDDYKVVADMITTKPATPYVTVEPITKE